MPTLLVELGCEELPSSAVEEAALQLPALAAEHLGAAPDELFVGPRRLALLLRDVPAETPEEWVAGPPVRVGEQAAEGFARKLGVARADLVERHGVLGVVRPPRPAAATLPARVEALVAGLQFGKSMEWSDGERRRRFSRPLRWTLVKLDEQTVVGETSFGHRFTTGPVEIPDAADYAERLRHAGVEPDQAIRRQRIVDGLDALGGWRDPLGKLDEVVNLVESPQVVEAAFDERFLRLPPRVVETAMQAHQRYFPLGGNRFAFVANGGDPEVVRRGNERVLEGRLEDAAFTFDRDVAETIEGLAARLRTITFFQGAGSYADKTERVVALVRAHGGGADALEAARLAKADQAAELVREFPELEGHIGAEYARLGGANKTVCAALDEQYLPDGADAPLPSTESGRLLAAADKLDTLQTAFALGHRPSGSRDPYALRRAAIGLVRLAVEGDLDLRLPDGEVRAFVEDRLEGVLGVPVEVVRAARGAGRQDVRETAALARFLDALPDERLAPVHEVHTRAARIVGDRADDEPVDPALLREESERSLAAALAGFVPSGELERDFDGAAALAPVVERFFDDVLVLDPDEAVRANRLRLLRDLRDRVGALGDFSQLPR
jgi:glycyl-tRNA synthetase beta chain